MVGAKRITPVINLGGTAGILPPVPFCGREVLFLWYVIARSRRSSRASVLLARIGTEATKQSPINRRNLLR
jgi:hypothetical protein